MPTNCKKLFVLLMAMFSVPKHIIFRHPKDKFTFLGDKEPSTFQIPYDCWVPLEIAYGLRMPLFTLAVHHNMSESQGLIFCCSVTVIIMLSEGKNQLHVLK